MVLGISLEVKLVVVGVGDDYLCLLHVHADGKDALQGEVRVLDVPSVHFLVLIEQVRVLELLNGLLRDLGDPVVHAQAPVFKDNLLKVVKFVTLVIIGLEVFEKLTNVLFFVHDLRRVRQVNRLNHHTGNGALFDSEEFEQVLFVDLSDELADFDVTVEVLATTATRQVDKVVAMEATLFIKLVVNRDNVFLFEQTLGGVLQLTYL